MTATLISSRSVQLLAVSWVVAILLAYFLGADGLPFERPGLEGVPVIGQTVVLPVVFMTIYLLIFLGVTYLITRRRAIPDISNRAPERALALKESGVRDLDFIFTGACWAQRRTFLQGR